ncbi:MAG TPA: metallophosphoesterase N-terminal domain-containing protein [Pirellulaceae bacterium]|nr:metallophosphoesterase N-terminal domain-containing protein [Pirellulaceae bacterium]
MRFPLLLGLVVSGFLIALSISATRAETPDGAGVSSEVLNLLLKETPKPNYGVPVPKQINGHVMLRSDGAASGVKGISVTDGYSVVKTGAQGAYTLTPHASAVFIYITRPSGHDVQGHWYKPLAAEVDFSLKPAEHDENEFIFVHVTDTHVSTNPRSVAGLSRFVREVNALTPTPHFVVNSGDLLNLHKALVTSPAAGRADFRNYVGIMNHLTMPHYNVAGDHTDSSYRLEEFPRGDHRCGKPLYWEHLGPNFFSFEYGKIHFMSVDFGYHLGQRQIQVNGQNLEYPTLMVQPLHTEWMRQDMANRSRGNFVVTTAEHDLTEHCPGFLEMARRHDVRLQLVGDHHVVAYKSRPVPYRIGGALAGCWWNLKAQQLCPDLSPQGYLIYRVTGQKMDHFYKGLGQRVAVTSHRVGAAWTGRLEVRAHVVQPQPNETLEYSLNDATWKPMREIGRPFYRALFSAAIDTTTLPEGHLNFSVKSTTTGEVRSRQFVVVNGGSPSEFKTDAVLSITVGATTGWTTHRPPAGKADVLFNGKVVGVLEPKARKNYSFKINASSLGVANTLSFRFAEPGDGMSLSSPVLTFQGEIFRDPRDEAIRQVRTGHWGKEAADWGGFIVGDAQPPDETPFHRQQNLFCFVLSGASPRVLRP